MSNALPELVKWIFNNIKRYCVWIEKIQTIPFIVLHDYKEYLAFLDHQKNAELHNFLASTTTHISLFKKKVIKPILLYSSCLHLKLILDDNSPDITHESEPQNSSPILALPTNNVHLFDDDLRDLLGCCDLCLLPQQSPDGGPDDEQDTLAGVHGIHMSRCGFGVSHQIQDVVQENWDVPLQPQAAHRLHKLDVSLSKVFISCLKKLIHMCVINHRGHQISYAK